MYDNYVFDLYDSIINIQETQNKELVWDKMALFYGFMGAGYESNEFERKYNKVNNKMINMKSNRRCGEADILDVFYKLYSDKGVIAKKKLIKETALLFRALTIDNIKLYSGVEKALAELKSQNKKIYLLTNGQSIYANGEMEYLNIKDYFDGIYISSDYGVCKPSKDFVNELFEGEKLKKKHTVFIMRNHLEDIDLAKDIGVKYKIILDGKTEKDNNLKEHYINNILELL